MILDYIEAFVQPILCRRSIAEIKTLKKVEETGTQQRTNACYPNPAYSWLNIELYFKIIF